MLRRHALKAATAALVLSGLVTAPAALPDAHARRKGVVPPDDAPPEVVAEHLQRFAERAWRRPVKMEELEQYLQSYRSEREAGEKLADAYRVLKPGGRFFCLEFSKVTSAPVGRVYDAYSERALPFFGKIIAKDADSYRYLHESIRRFPPQRELAARMRAVGFANVAWRDMSLGVVALHQGWRI